MINALKLMSGFYPVNVSLLYGPDICFPLPCQPMFDATDYTD
jgi:hypothetical protein